MVGHRPGVKGDRGIHLGVRFQRLDGRDREERQERKLDPLPAGEVLLRAASQPRYRGDIDIHDGGELRGGLQRGHHALGDDPAVLG